MCDGLRRFVGLVLRVVFFWRAAWVLEGVGCMCDYVVLPLLNSSFEPGRAREVVEGAYSARTAHPFQRNGAPFRFKLSKAQQVD